MICTGKTLADGMPAACGATVLHGQHRYDERLVAAQRERATPEVMALAARVRVLAVDWSTYRACPTCKVPTGAACRAMSGRVVNGQADGVTAVLEHAHAARKLRRVRRTSAG